MIKNKPPSWRYTSFLFSQATTTRVLVHESTNDRQMRTRVASSRATNGSMYTRIEYCIRSNSCSFEDGYCRLHCSLGCSRQRYITIKYLIDRSLTE